MRTLCHAVQLGFDILLPPRCANCGILVRTPGLCAGCWRQLNMIVPPVCVVCGLPEAYRGAGLLAGCAGCLDARDRGVLDRGRSALVYDAGSRDLVLGFKYADRTDRAPLLARWLVVAGADLWPVADVIVPVPLHWRRLWARRYNQAALLAQAVARQTGVPCALDAVRRMHHTAPQKGLNPAARRRNVAHQFMVRTPQRIAGQRVVLVDDVWTTGATLAAVATCLKAAGAREVSALTVARVLPDAAAVDSPVDNYVHNQRFA